MVEDDCKVDKMSLLPDEILVLIVSLLNYKEATATSILGRRWRYLHHWTRKLDFDGTGSILKLENIHNRTQNHVNEERQNYIEWVDRAIAANKSSTLDEFRVYFNLDRSESPAIDQWLRFALSRRVETLELNLTNKGGVRNRKYADEVYILPEKNLFTTEFPSLRFASLKKLSTNFVNVSGKFVAELLRNCPHLRHLSITRSQNLSPLEIIKPFPSFKCLEIALCPKLKSLVIRDSSIVTLKVMTRGNIECVVLENVPLLSELWSWPAPGSLNLEETCSMFSSVFRQLRLLKIFISKDDFLDDAAAIRFYAAVEMSNLKQLVVVVLQGGAGGYGCRSLSPIIHFMRASPKLERLVVEVVENPERRQTCTRINRITDGRHGGMIPFGVYMREDPPGTERKMEIARYAGQKIPRRYLCLKEMEVVGYRDQQIYFDLVMHAVGNAVALRNIVLDPSSLDFHCDSWWELIAVTETSDGLRQMALDLTNYVPPRINVTILE